MWAKEKREKNRKFTNGMRIVGAKEANAKFITQQGKGTRHRRIRRGSTENTKSVSKRVRDSRESVLSRSPLRGTSMQDETRMHVSVQRSASSKEENEVKVKREKRICERE